MQQSILVIDDDENLTSAMAEALTDAGYRVVCSATSAEGLLLAQMQHPDAILCDVGLPDAVGFDTVSALRAHSATCQVPVVLITGDHDASKYEGSGDGLMLIKPFSIETLIEVVRGTLAAKRKSTPVAG
jgi:DNA-binding response OmpR family regulator